jgi:hypothetical protein
VGVIEGVRVAVGTLTTGVAVGSTKKGGLNGLNATWGLTKTIR